MQTVPEVAVALGKSVQTVFRLLAAGELHRIKIGRDTRIPDDSVQEYLDRCAAQPQR
jgi:excisionase family DNA binding protein